MAQCVSELLGYKLLTYNDLSLEVKSLPVNQRSIRAGFITFIR